MSRIEIFTRNFRCDSSDVCFVWMCIMNDGVVMVQLRGLDYVWVHTGLHEWFSGAIDWMRLFVAGERWLRLWVMKLIGWLMGVGVSCVERKLSDWCSTFYVLSTRIHSKMNKTVSLFLSPLSQICWLACRMIRYECELV